MAARFVYLKPIVTAAMDLYDDSKKWRRPLWKWAYSENDRLSAAVNLVELKRQLRIHQGGENPVEEMKRTITRGIIQEVLRQALWERDGGVICSENCGTSMKCPHNDIPEDLLCPFRAAGWKRRRRNGE